MNLLRKLASFIYPFEEELADNERLLGGAQVNNDRLLRELNAVKQINQRLGRVYSDNIKMVCRANACDLEMEKLRVENNDRKQELERYKAELNTYNNTIEDLRSSNSYLTKVARESREHNAHLSNSYSELEAKHEALEKEAAHRVKQLEDAKNIIGNYTDDLNTQNAYIEKLKIGFSNQTDQLEARVEYWRDKYQKIGVSD